MGPIEVTYIALVLFAFVGFALVLAYCAHRNP